MKKIIINTICCLSLEMAGGDMAPVEPEINIRLAKAGRIGCASPI